MAGVRPRNRGGGAISAYGGGNRFFLSFQIEGLQKTSDEFKAVRKDINKVLRDTVVAVGNETLVPDIRKAFPVKEGLPKTGLKSGAMAASIYVKRDRTTVFIGSRLRGSQNRALGWIDFGGQRARDNQKHTGPHVIVSVIDEHAPTIDAKLRSAYLRNFEEHGFEVI